MWPNEKASRGVNGTTVMSSSSTVHCSNKKILHQNQKKIAHFEEKLSQSLPASPRPGPATAVTAVTAGHFWTISGSEFTILGEF